MYAGALGDNAVLRYSMFLTSLDVSTDIGERKLALTRARDHGLDMERVAVATAERTIEKAFSVSILAHITVSSVFIATDSDTTSAQRSAPSDSLPGIPSKQYRNVPHPIY